MGACDAVHPGKCCIANPHEAPFPCLLAGLAPGAGNHAPARGFPGSLPPPLPVVAERTYDEGAPGRDGFGCDGRPDAVPAWDARLVGGERTGPGEWSPLLRGPVARPDSTTLTFEFYRAGRVPFDGTAGRSYRVFRLDAAAP